MIIGIGTDVASIPRILDVLELHDMRFVRRCFSQEEIHRVEGVARGDKLARASGYAKRWAAKEAAAKALGRGIYNGIFLKDISVVNDAAGAPALVLSGGAKDRLTALVPKGMTARTHVSLSDEHPMALAFVVISAGGA